MQTGTLATWGAPLPEPTTQAGAGGIHKKISPCPASGEEDSSAGLIDALNKRGGSHFELATRLLHSFRRPAFNDHIPVSFTQGIPIDRELRERALSASDISWRAKHRFRQPGVVPWRGFRSWNSSCSNRNNLYDRSRAMFDQLVWLRNKLTLAQVVTPIVCK